MNSKISELISSIEDNFNRIYKANINDFKDILDNKDPINFEKVSIESWEEKDIAFLIERALIGIEYYLLNFSKADNIKYAFPIISYNSLKQALYNGNKIIFIYTKNVPSFNQSLIEFIRQRS
jgi:hypothetical protein